MFKTNYIFIFLSIIISNVIYAQISLNEQYFIAFDECFNIEIEDYEAHSSDNIYHLDTEEKGFTNPNLWQLQLQKGINDGIPRYQIVDRPQTNAGYKCLKLTLGPEDYTSGGHRIELLYKPKRSSGTYFYSWDFFIPDSNEWDENDYYADGSLVPSIFIAQWHNSSFTKVHDNRINYVRDDNPSQNNLPPPIVFNYQPEYQSELANDNKRALGISYGLYRDVPNVEELLPYKRRSYIIENLIKVAAWNNIVTEIKWSHEHDGYMKVWMNKNPYAEPDVYIQGPNLNLFGNWQNKPYPINNCGIIYENDLEVENSNTLRCNTFKIGLYKGRRLENSNEDYDNIYLDNFMEVSNKEDLDYSIEDNEYPNCSTNKVEPLLFKVYPNPSNGIFKIYGYNKECSIKFYDVLGKNLFVKQLYNNHFELKNNPNGLVFARILYKNKVTILRIMTY